MIKIGTRSSRLALIQAEIVKSKLEVFMPGLKLEIVPMKTSGDKILDKNLYEIGGKGLFIKEIEEALLSRSIDLAVHSLKDVPGLISDQLAISCVLEREDPRDAFLSNNFRSIEELPVGAVVGTSSPRRAAQILNMRPDLKIVCFRGNVDTRLSKLENGTVDATILAVAGLKRMGIDSSKYNIINDDIMLPAVAQGVIGIETRKSDLKVQEIVMQINHLKTAIEVRAERSFLAGMNASCSTPIAAYAQIKDDGLLYMRSLIASPDGSKIWRKDVTGSKHDASKLGLECAEYLKNYE